MMEYSLEDDIPDEFKGGKLQLNIGDRNKSNESIKLVNDNTQNNSSSSPSPKEVSNTNDIETTCLDNSLWKAKIFTPLSELTESVWNRKPSSSRDVPTQVVQPTFLSLVAENANNYFTYRDGVIEKAVCECSEQLLDSETDGPIIKVLLLTEIDLWDTDKERLILLTPNTILVIKYDFIALKRVEFKKIYLKEVDTVIIGDLVYPKKSLVPRINGLAEGMSNTIQSIMFQNWNKNEGLYSLFQSRNRNMYGIRLLWNKNQPISFSTKWNPFTSKIPFATFTSHPLYFHKDCQDEERKKLFDIKEFIDTVCHSIADLEMKKLLQNTCITHHKDIVLENYLSIGSIIHNRNALGYFKVRGKFSF